MNTRQRSPFLTALFDPLILTMLGLVAAASLCAAWWLFPIGLVLYLVMFMVVVRNPTLRFNNMLAKRAPLAQRFQTRFDRLQKPQINLFNSLSTTKPKARRALKPVQGAINGAVEQAYRLSQRMSTIENHIIVSRTYRDPEVELAQVMEKIAAATDPALKQDYEDTRKTLEQQIANFSSMSALLERFEVQLAALATVLDGAVTTVIRMQALEKANLRQQTGAVLDAIRDQLRQLTEFEAQVAGYKNL